MTTSTLTPRQTFRETVALVADKARAKLPIAVNGRIESAVKLVLAGDVLFCEDGTVEVGSSDPTRYYRLVGPTCTCTDYTSGKAPEGWCKHRTAAGILKRVQELLPAAPQPVPEVPEGLEPWPDNDPEPEPTEKTRPMPTPLPEAPASCNVYVMIGGHKVQVTLRDVDEHRMLERLQAVLAQYPAAQPQAQPGPQLSAAQHRPVSGFCPVHQVQMRWNEGKDGRQGWFSHRLPDDEGWCKGKGQRRPTASPRGFDGQGEPW